MVILYHQCNISHSKLPSSLVLLCQNAVFFPMWWKDHLTKHSFDFAPSLNSRTSPVNISLSMRKLLKALMKEATWDVCRLGRDKYGLEKELGLLKNEHLHPISLHLNQISVTLLLHHSKIWYYALVFFIFRRNYNDSDYIYKPNHIIKKLEASCHQSLIRPREESVRLIWVFFYCEQY